MSEDELDKLIIREDTIVDKAEIYHILSEYARVSDKGKFLPEPAFHDLKSAQKLVVYLIARKAAVIQLPQLSLTEAAKKSDIRRETGIPQGSVWQAWKDSGGIVEHDKQGYYLPNYNISRVKTLFSE